MATKDTAVDEGMKRVDSALKIQPHRGYPGFEDLRAVARAILEHIAAVPDLAAEKTPEELARMTPAQRAAAAHERQVLAAKAMRPVPPVQPAALAAVGGGLFSPARTADVVTSTPAERAAVARHAEELAAQGMAAPLVAPAQSARTVQRMPPATVDMTQAQRDAAEHERQIRAAQASKPPA